MFSTFLSKTIQKIAPKTFKIILKEGAEEEKKRLKIQNEQEKKTLDDFRIAEFDRQFPINGLVVAIPNEASNPVVGRITNYYDSGSTSLNPLLIVHDYVSNSEKIIPCFTLPYSETFLKAVMVQDVYQRHLSYYKSHKDFQTIDQDLIDSFDEMKIILENNGFYKYI